MKETFKERRFGAEALAQIERANAIIAEYQADGYALTLRQLYYQFVARGLLENTLREYKRLGVAVNHGRMAGLIDWEAIEDHTRSVRELSAWDSPESIMEPIFFSAGIWWMVTLEGAVKPVAAP